jgi:Trk K+ transport system NAD-binding subunit
MTRFHAHYDRRMPAPPERTDRRRAHLVVCGDGPLAYRITEELTSRYGEQVTVVVPSRQRHYGPQISGLAAIPVATAIIVGARLTGSVRGAPRPAGGHVIVVGLGNVGTSVTGQLHDLGFDVACIDNNPDALGIPMARQLGLPVVIGDAFRDETLRAAGLDTCIALVSVTSQDIVNLETALNARALRDDVRIVLRLTDDDLAERLQKTISNTVSRSVPYLAAPAFAIAMLEHQVLRTIAVGRHVLLIADVQVGDQVGLAGNSVRDTEHDGQARVLALQSSGSAGLDWSPARGHLLAVGDRLIVLATRKGLEPFLSVREPYS